MANSTSTSAMRPSSARRRSEEHTSELQSQSNLVCRLLLEKKKQQSEHQLQLDTVCRLPLATPKSVYHLRPLLVPHYLLSSSHTKHDLTTSHHELCSSMTRS